MTTIGPKGPRGPPGPTGLPGDDYNPSMTTLSTNVAIVTDTVTDLPPEIGKYWVPYTSLLDAYNDPAVEHIILHKTQAETLPVGYRLTNRTIHIQGMTSSCPVQIPDTLTQTTFTLTDVQILQSSVTANDTTLSIRTCESVPGQSISFGNTTGVSTIIIMESQLNMNQVLSQISSQVILLSSRINLGSSTLFNVTTSTVLSTGNIYTFPQSATATLITGLGYTISSTHDTLRLMNTPNLNVSAINGLALVSAMSVISNLTPMINMTVGGDSIVQPIDVNGRFKDTRYNDSGWYGYSLVTDITDSVYYAGITDRFIQIQDSSVNLLSVEVPGMELVISFAASPSARTIVTTEWTYNVPNTPLRVKLIRMENRWVQFGS
jgi:hypothetical protein